LIALALLIIICGLFYIFMYQGAKGKEIYVRRLPAMNALPEAIGRCAEMGKPLFYTTGVGGLKLSNASQGPQTLASISIMESAAKLCAKNGVRIDVFTPIADALPLIEETLRMSYLVEGSSEEFNRDMINFVPEYDPYVAGCLGYLQRERPASCILMGGFASESVILGEAGNTIGALQIGGTANTSQIPFLVATCDFVLISEELYAASASISNDPNILGSLKGEDFVKMLLVGLVLVGYLLALVRNDLLIKLLGV
jgi:hypothetical protein